MAPTAPNVADLQSAIGSAVKAELERLLAIKSHNNQMDVDQAPDTLDDDIDSSQLEDGSGGLLVYCLFMLAANLLRFIKP